MDPVETQLLSQWWSDYRTQYAAVKNLLMYESQMAEIESAATVQIDDEDERKRRLVLNAEWNLETRKLASVHLQTLLNRLSESHDQRLSEFQRITDASKSEDLARLDAIATLCPSMITKDNIDQKVEEIINSDVVEYNFMLDPKGSVLRGTQPYKPPASEHTSGKSTETDPGSPTSTDITTAEV